MFGLLGFFELLGKPLAARWLHTLRTAWMIALPALVGGFLVLAAHAMCLATCPIGLITAFDEDIREQLNLSDEKEVVIGVAVGYKDPSSGVNKVRTERAPLEEFVKWRE